MVSFFVAGVDTEVILRCCCVNPPEQCGMCNVREWFHLVRFVR